MAHIEDRWEKTVDGERIRTTRHGQGMRWRARYLDPDGHQRSKMFARKIDAERFLASVTTDMLRGAYVDPSAGKVTFADFAARWLEARTFGESSREATEVRLRVHAYPHLGRRQLRDLRPSVIQAWVRGLQERLAASYVRVIFANVSAVLAAAVDDGLAAVIDALPSRYRATAVVAAGCGLRQREVFGLRVHDVDFLRRQLHVEQQVKLLHGKVILDRPKGGKTRTVPLPTSVADELAAHLQRYPAQGAELVFTSREDKPINRSHFDPYIWHRALKAVGVEPSRQNGMHALRHFYASVLIDAGESVKAVAEYLGHADPGFTLRVYAHLFPSSEERARAALDRVLGEVFDRPMSAERVP